MPGTVTLVAVNKGKIAHSLAISGPGVASRRITGTIKPGTSRSLTVTLKAGTYTLKCPIDGHAALGMKTTLKSG
jgi:plastocyanin